MVDNVACPINFARPPQRMSDTAPLQSGVAQSPADGMLVDAIAVTLQAAADARAALFAQLVADIEAWIKAHPDERPWTCTPLRATDGAHVFRGGVGHSLVIDAAGRMWRARSYEDFVTTYNIADGRCDIATLTPLYAQMRQYRPNVRWG